MALPPSLMLLETSRSAMSNFTNATRWVSPVVWINDCRTFLCWHRDGTARAFPAPGRHLITFHAPLDRE